MMRGLLTAAVFLIAAADYACAQGPLQRAFNRVTGRQVAGTDCVGPNCSKPSPAPFVSVPAEAPLPMPAAPFRAMKSDPPKSAADSKTTAAGSKVGAGFCALVRAELRKEFRKQGMNPIQAWKAAAEFDDETIRGATSDAEKLSGQTVGQLGDGTLLKLLIDFINSPTGKMIIDLIVKLLLGGLEPVAIVIGSDGHYPAGCPPPFDFTLAV